MRIRKHATRSIASPPIPTLFTAGHGRAKNAEAVRDVKRGVCRLNRSPWDALSPMPAETFELQSKEGEDKDAVVRTLTAAQWRDLQTPGSASRVSSSVEPAKTSSPEKLARPKTPRGKKMSQTKKGLRLLKRHGEIDAKEEGLSSASASGKVVGDNLCTHVELHAPVEDQMRTINNKKTSQKMKNKKQQQREKEDLEGMRSGKRKAGLRKSIQSPDIYVYYSGFGPDRGKRRRRGSLRRSSEPGGEGDAGLVRNLPGPCRSEEDDEDDDVAVALAGEFSNDAVIEIKRTGRKPIKARSLRSIL
ncbi:uncharacterized protein LOC144711928 [Wolffia australiana]